VNGVFDSRTLTAVRAFQRGAALRVTGKLDVLTWWTLLATPPAAVKWAPAGARAARAGWLPEPASARLPARAREIPPKLH
jgi:hypothetical protein